MAIIRGTTLLRYANGDLMDGIDGLQTILGRRGYVPGITRLSMSLLNILGIKGAQASAELLPFERACSLFGHDPDATLVILYSTQTCNSRLAREAVSSYLKGRGFHVVEAEVRGTKSAEDFEEGLVDLVDKVVRLVTDWKKIGARVFINATPGFKAEASFLVLASLIAGADVIYYMHESFRDIVILPTIPLDIRREYLEIVVRLLEHRDPREAEWIAGDPEMLRELELRGLVEKDQKGYIARKWVRKLLELTPQRERSAWARS